MKDYHHLLREILSGLQSCQQSKDMGLFWDLTYEDETELVLLKMPVLFVAGDSEGHDKLCGKYRGANCKRICRYCEFEQEQISFPIQYNKFKMTTKEEVQLIQQSNPEGLKEISQHNIRNAFYDIVFCDNRRSIHGACPAEVSHCHQHGICPKVMDSILTMKKAPEIIRHNAKLEMERNKSCFNERSLYDQQTKIVPDQKRINRYYTTQKMRKTLSTTKISFMIVQLKMINHDTLFLTKQIGLY